MSVVGGQTADRTGRQSVDRTTLHRVWKLVLAVTAMGVATACYFAPLLLVVIALALAALACARLAYRGRDRYIPNLYSRDISVYDDDYQAFIRRSLSDLRHCRIADHTLLWEASQLVRRGENTDDLLLDLGVWIGWSTRLTSEATGQKVYGFDTFEGLVEDWAVDDQIVVKRGTFALSEPLAQRFIRDTGVTLQDGIPPTLGRDVEFIKGMTYETLAPFLADRPTAPITLFHMDLDTYESCQHALETCKNHFVEGSILVFDEYLVTNGEMRAFYEFQEKYGLQWRYRAWGLEVWEMNVEMVTSRWKRFSYYAILIAGYWLLGDGRYAWAFFGRRFWRFWLGAPLGDIAFMLGAAGQRKSVSLEITGLGTLGRAQDIR